MFSPIEFLSCRASWGLREPSTFSDSLPALNSSLTAQNWLGLAESVRSPFWMGPKLASGPLPTWKLGLDSPLNLLDLGFRLPVITSSVPFILIRRAVRQVPTIQGNALHPLTSAIGFRDC